MNNQVPRFRNAEIDEICECLIRQHEGKTYDTQPVDIVDFAINYFKLKLMYVSIAENDPNKLSFLGDGVTAIKVYYQGKIQSVLIPEKTILLDKVLKYPHERSRRYFCIAHEVFHYIESILTNSPVVSAYHREFDSSREYPMEELSEMMSFRECQADRGAAALLMPSALVRNTCLQFTNGKNICIYGENVFTTKDKEILQDMATYLGVSYTALTIRMKQLKLFEKHKLDEYISNELHLNNGKAGG
jgi:hypothetical protein